MLYFLYCYHILKIIRTRNRFNFEKQIRITIKDEIIPKSTLQIHNKHKRFNNAKIKHLTWNTLNNFHNFTKLSEGMKNKLVGGLF